MAHEQCQALDLGLQPFCADDPIDRRSLVPRRLCLKEGPRLRGVTELLFESGWKSSGLSLLVGIDRRSGSFSFLKCSQSRRMHQSQLRKLGRALDIDSAPGAARLARRKPDLVTEGVDPFADSIDPTKAKRAVDGFWPGNARPSRVALVETTQSSSVEA